MGKTKRNIKRNPNRIGKRKHMLDKEKEKEMDLDIENIDHTDTEDDLYKNTEENY